MDAQKKKQMKNSISDRFSAGTIYSVPEEPRFETLKYRFVCTVKMGQPKLVQVIFSVSCIYPRFPRIIPGISPAV